MSLLTDREIVELCAHSDSDYELVQGTMAAVIKKLATVSVEPVAWLAEYGGDVYTADTIAAARVQALEEAAAICDRNAQSTSADEIRALINSLK